MTRRATRQTAAHPPFFLAAALFAALSIPLWGATYAGLLPGGPHPATAPAHGHKMLFGYALAVVAGYLVTRISAAWLGALLGLWLAGRLLPLMSAPPGLVAAVAFAFPVALFAFAGLPFLRAAKRWRNAIFGVVIGAFALAEGIYQLGVLGVIAGGEAQGVRLGLDLITLLLFAMGGRIIAAATSGALQRQGLHLPGLAQPWLERLGLLGLIAMTILNGAGAPATAAWCAALVAFVIAVRLIGWRVWRVAGVLEVASLHLGYAWLAAGLALKAAAHALDALPPADALHAITVGALGTLTIAMMTRVSLQRARRPIVMPAASLLAIGLVNLAAVLRLVAVGQPAILLLASASWSLGFAAMVWWLARLRGRARPP